MSWTRPYYQAGGGEPSLLWVVFGDFEPLRLDPAVHRTRGLPDGISLRSVDRAAVDFPDFLTRDLLGDRLDAELPDLADEVRHAPAVRVLEGAPGPAARMDWLAEVVGVTVALLERGGVAVVDPVALRWWSEDALRDALFDVPTLDPHAVVRRFASIEPSGTWWMRTRGMRLFGRPDVSLRGVHPDDRAAAEEVLGRLVSAQAAGAVVPADQVVAWEGRAWRCRAAGAPDDPDFLNVHLALEEVSP